MMSLKMRAIGPQDIHKIPPGPCLVQRKLDGVFSMLFHANGETVLVDAAGRCRDESDVPFLANISKHLANHKITEVSAAGELWCDNGENRERVRYVMSETARPKYFSAFDLMGAEKPACIPAADARTVDRDEVSAIYDQWVTRIGAEGLVVRDSQGGIWKIKPSHTIDACILGYAEGNPGEVRDVLLGVWRGGVWQRICSCGTGFDRAALLKQLRPMAADSDYTETNSEHVPYRMVLPRVAVELEFTDLTTDNAQGEAVRRPVLEYNGRWKQVAKKPGVSVIFPRILRVRDDKDGQDCRMSQITDLVEVEGSDEPVELSPEPRQTLARAVFTKTIKGQMAVRKLVLLRLCTKPEYVIHYTDFSAGRKTPLERDLYASNDALQCKQRFVAWAREIQETRGWEHVPGKQIATLADFEGDVMSWYPNKGGK